MVNADHISELEEINIKLANLYHPRREAKTEYRQRKSEWEVEEAKTLTMLDNGDIGTGYKPSEKDKHNYTIDRCGTLYKELSEAKGKLESMDAEFQMLDTRRSVIQTILKSKD